MVGRVFAYARPKWTQTVKDLKEGDIVLALEKISQEEGGRWEE